MTRLLPTGHLVGGRYRVCDLIATGGMGAVYEVEDRDGSRYALKAPLPEVASDALVSARFRREIGAVRLLDHPNLVRAVDDLVEHGVLYLVLELARGPTLADELERGPIHPHRTLLMARQILDGLEHAHGLGMVHRDLKPDNVILTRGHQVPHIKLIDFGVVKLLETATQQPRLTRRGTTFGTPRYIAPEQARGAVIDGRADLYSLGVILFEALTGDLPFFHKEDRELMRMHVKNPPPTLAERAPGVRWLTPALEDLIARALTKPAADRHADAPAMRVALDIALASIADLA